MDIDDMLDNAQLATDPRLCPWCGEPYEVAPMRAAAVRFTDGTGWQSFGDSMTFSSCAKDGVFVIS